ncbi:MAG: hypothetical protein JWO78_2070 [Micavibrio sp.]|nr:hypothetical protein [Micavibrio sp.]
MRLLILLLIALFISAPVIAAEQGMIVINPDGTVTESGAAADPMARHNAARAAVIKSEKINPPEPDTPKPVMNLEPEPEQKAEPAPVPEAKPEPVKVKPPVKKPVKQKTSPVKAATPKATKSKKQAAAPVQNAAGAEPSPKIKWNKPSKKKLKPITIETAPVNAPEPQTPVAPISRDQALRAAIQVAPPFRSSRVVPAEDNGRQIYRVILQTEDGEQEILVNRQTGEILR